jgi:hypothetical protein
MTRIENAYLHARLSRSATAAVEALRKVNGTVGQHFFVPHDSTLRDGFIRFYPDRIDQGNDVSRRISSAAA